MIKRVSDSYKKNLFWFILGPLLKAIEAFFDLLMPLIMKAVIDLSTYNEVEAIPSTSKVSQVIASIIRSLPSLSSTSYISDSLWGLIFILSMGIIGFAITMCTQYIAAKVAMNVGTEVRESLYQKVLSLSQKERERFGTNKLITILNSDTYQIQQGALIFIRLIVRAPFIIIGALVISLLLNWKIGIIFACIVPLVIIVIFKVMSYSSKGYVKIQERLDDLSKETEETVEGNKVIKAYNREDYENEKFSSNSGEYRKSALKVNKINALINPLTFAIVSIATILVVAIGGHPILESASEEGILLATTILTEISYLAQISFALIQMGNIVLIFTKSNVSKKRVDSVLEIYPSIVNNENAERKDINEGEEIISFNDVSFGYEEDGNYALENISFKVNKGMSLGIIGGTGSGKSTIISLMERFVDASKGEIKYKGIGIKDYNLVSLRDEISLSKQKSILFKGTIASNLRIAKSDATDEEIIEALKLSNAYEFVNKYDDGINHVVNEGGSNFSGGQKQRLCIARALLKNSEILILDDSTSALDLLTEKSVRDNIQKSFKNLTKIIVSQRISSVRDCDLILVLDGGKLVASGSHNELLSSCSLYKETYETQVEEASL